MKGKLKLHFLYEYQLNTYLTVDSEWTKSPISQFATFA